jgi:hypothetical protein
VVNLEFIIDPERKYVALKKYGKDLAGIAKAGKLYRKR